MFQFSPLFSEYFTVSEIFSNFSSQKFSYKFHPPKFLMTSFIIVDSQFIIPPVFAKTIHFLLFRKIFHFPYFGKFPPDFVKFTCLTYFRPTCFSCPPTLTMMHLCITQCTTGRPCPALPSSHAISFYYLIYIIADRKSSCQEVMMGKFWDSY